ncbi:MAG: flagellar hook-length control protein FliK, partial [Rhodospirillaceae bacterium]|nr:flagellar hook-length control protein FliK [Rhodospirillaceae bacterium]
KTPVPPKQIADQVKVSITKGVDEGLDKINIRLRPNELGRIEVKLNVANDGTVRAMITADRPETLDVLRRDAAGMEKALQDAGLKTGQDSLSFSLRDQSGQNGQGSANNENRNRTPYGQILSADSDMDASETSLSAYAGSARADGVDIRV